MLKENDYAKTDEFHFKNNQRKPDEDDNQREIPALIKEENEKITNRKPLAGRMPWDPKTNRRFPFTTSEKKRTNKTMG